jgi:hypothetical protein
MLRRPWPCSGVYQRILGSRQHTDVLEFMNSIQAHLGLTTRSEHLALDRAGAN